ncbi:tyrosine-type recombinase/integrase [Rhodomicrobium vannielii ATCC 17100]|uniref:tyrosine-type recombinase/integrase n=1 Tax=Rhodomicrobium vannielii TaxID=1069 RepID=UPI001917B4F8|nr:tyrosine-type recombinase/integrase [Rhodomicrobium vannielii]MBJ7532701.1 tyrosine-type recombinase/integrase [Rhodomicrobium vannielii ATCC 17100]
MGRGSSLMRRPSRYCHGYIDCRGKPRWYLRRAGYKRVPLPGLPWSPEFMAAYEVAMAGKKIESGKSRVKPGSVADVIVLYYQTAAFTRLSDATRQTYRGILERFRADYGELPVAKLEEQHIGAILDKKAATPAAANNLRRMLRAIMKLARKRKMISVNPMTEIEPIRYKVKGFKDWSDDEIELFAARYPMGTRERLAFELMLCAAPRRSDVVRLKRSNLCGGRLVYRQKKTGAEIDIPILQQLAVAIEAMPVREGQELLIETQFGKAFTETGFYNWFTEKARMAGVPKGRSPHGLRKACCRRLAEAGCSPHEIMSVSGHETLREVERYTKAANRAWLADSAIYALQEAQKGDGASQKRKPGLANRLGNVSQSSTLGPDFAKEKNTDGGGGESHTAFDIVFITFISRIYGKAS